MKILAAHNRYLQPGGEDVVFEQEVALLQTAGNQVWRFELSNEDLLRISSIATAIAAVWNESARRSLKAVVEHVRPDVVHFHNTFPRLSPAAYSAARPSGAAVVQTLHNFRLICPAATLYRNGAPCHDCIGRTPPWSGIIHACYRGSRLASGAVATMLTLHRILRTYDDEVDAYVALTQHGKRLLIAGGLPAERISVKPNFVEHTGQSCSSSGDHVLFVGRLTEDKGVRVLLAAWGLLNPRPDLVLCGGGPLEADVTRAVGGHREGRWTGHLPPERVRQHLQAARVLVVPSLWYEAFGIVVVEAFAAGVPVIASNHGALAEIVEDGRTGWLFEPGNPDDLAAKISEAWSNPAEAARRGKEARLEYEAKYTPDRNYQMLMEIYEKAIAHRRSR